MGIIRLEEKQLEDAAGYIKRCLEINRKYVPGMLAMGNMMYESGHSNTAAKYFQQALNINPHDLQALIDEIPKEVLEQDRQLQK